MDSIRVMSRKFKASPLLREFLAEMMGTFILMVFGIGSVAQFVLGRGQFGTFLSVNIGWGLGVTLGVFWSAGISGGHINPSVSLAMACFGRLPWKKLPVFWAAQSLGSLLASAVMYGVYADALDIYDGGKRMTTGNLATAGIWSTYPYSFGNKTVSNWAGFGDQVFGTMILVSTVFALTDKQNNAPRQNQLPYMIGCLVWAIGMTMGLNCGYGINPARDLIPRIFTAMAGWGKEPFTVNNYWFWYPVFGQLVGGVLGGVLYTLTISMHYPDDSEKSSYLVTGSTEDILTENVKFSKDSPPGTSNVGCEIIRA